VTYVSPQAPAKSRTLPGTAAHSQPLGVVAQVLVAWLPLGVILAEYLIAQLVNGRLSHRLQQGDLNALGFPLHITEPVTIDRWLFGELPTSSLQSWLYSPSGPQWHDAVASVVYFSHFWVIPLVAVVLWFRDKSLFRSWVGSVLLLTTIGVGIYILYPMSPPWLTSTLGITDAVHRISDYGWEYLHLETVGSWLASSQDNSNPVAAMPSLHAASAVLLTLFLWRRVGVINRVMLATYSVLMALTLVYTGEHYVVDVAAGWATAGIAFFGWSTLQRLTRQPGWFSARSSVPTRPGQDPADRGGYHDSSSSRAGRHCQCGRIRVHGQWSGADHQPATSAHTPVTTWRSRMTAAGIPGR